MAGGAGQMGQEEHFFKFLKSFWEEKFVILLDVDYLSVLWYKNEWNTHDSFTYLLHLMIAKADYILCHGHHNIK